HLRGPRLRLPRSRLPRDVHARHCRRDPRDAGSPVMSAVIVKFKPKGGGFDPVYSAIERHRAAVATHTEASHIFCNIDYGGPGGSPDYWSAKETASDASDQLSTTLRALLACRPATMEGLLALLDYVGQPEWPDDEDSEDRTTILSGSYERNSDD